MSGNRVTTIILIGPHAAGKTTLGRRIAAVLGCRFDDEIGERLRRTALAHDPSAHAQLQQDSFDEQVIQHELARDTAQEACHDSRVVETWHIGNLAYAQQRSPTVAARWERAIETAIQRACDRNRVIIQPLRIEEATLHKRQSEPGPADIARFFIDVAMRAERLSAEFGLAVASPLFTDRLDVDAALRQILSQVRV